MTCSDDARHRIWRVGLEHEEDNSEMKIRGQAEVVTIHPLEMKLETTPSSRNSTIYHQETTPSEDEHKTPVLGKNKLLFQGLCK